MAHSNNPATQPLRSGPLVKRMLVGAGIALLAITIFLLGAGEPDPAWPKFWMLKPLIVVPLAGATGGALYYFINSLSGQGGWRKALAVVLGVIVYLIGLWMGTVLGLDGTLWD